MLLLPPERWYMYPFVCVNYAAALCRCTTVNVSCRSPRVAAAALQVVDDYRSAALGGRRTTAAKRTRFGSFPPYLLVQINRWGSGAVWGGAVRGGGRYCEVHVRAEPSTWFCCTWFCFGGCRVRHTRTTSVLDVPGLDAEFRCW